MLFNLLWLVPPTGCSVPTGGVVERNFYALLCQTVQIDGTVRGDLIALGGTVIIGESGRVEGSVLGAGLAIQVRGRVGGSIRTLSNELTIAKSASLTGRTADISALALTFQSDALLPGDVWLAGRDARFNAPVQGQKYTALLPPSLPLTPAKLLADWIWATVQGWLGLMALGLFGLLSFPISIRHVADIMKTHPLLVWRRGEKLFFGGLLGLILLLLVGIGIVALLTVFSLGGLLVIGGIALGGLLITGLTIGLILFGLVAPALAALGISRWYQARLTHLPKGQAEFIGLLFGALIVAAFGNIPYIGIVFAQCFAAFGTGALWIYLRQRGFGIRPV